MIFSARKSMPFLSASRRHHILFYSPALGRLVVPFAVQTDLFIVLEKMEGVRFESPLSITSGLLYHGDTKQVENHD